MQNLTPQRSEKDHRGIVDAAVPVLWQPALDRFNFLEQLLIFVSRDVPLVELEPGLLLLTKDFVM